MNASPFVVGCFPRSCSQHTCLFQGGPDPGFTQRATLDPQSAEMFVLSGLVKEADSRAADSRIAEVQRRLWVYSLKDERWCVFFCARLPRPGFFFVAEALTAHRQCQVHGRHS